MAGTRNHSRSPARGGLLLFRRRLALNLLVDLFPMDGDVAGGSDAEADLLAADFEDHNLDVVADHDDLVNLPRQN